MGREALGQDRLQRGGTKWGHRARKGLGRAKVLGVVVVRASLLAMGREQDPAPPE